MMFKDDKEYYSDRTHLTNSSLKLIRQSPKKFSLWLAGVINEEPSDALQQGSALHALVLENKKIFIGYEGRRAGSKYDEFLSEDRDELFVFTKKDEKLIHDMHNALYNCNEAHELLFDKSYPAQNEIAGTKNIEGIWMKGKADRIIENNNLRIGVDLKTTGGDISEFSRSAKFYDYDMQSAVYSEIFDLDGFIFVVVSKKWPYEIGIFECSDEFTYAGRQKMLGAINLYKELFIDENYNPSNASYVGQL